MARRVLQDRAVSPIQKEFGRLGSSVYRFEALWSVFKSSAAKVQCSWADPKPDLEYKSKAPPPPLTVVKLQRLNFNFVTVNPHQAVTLISQNATRA